MAKQKRDQQTGGTTPRSNEPQQQRGPQDDPHRREQVREQVRGGMTSDQQEKRPTPREPGRMPLPD